VIENMSVDVLAVGEDMEQAQFVDYLQKNFLPAEDVYKPKKKKKSEPKGLEKFYDDEGDDINENSADY
jgi:acylphosphatase